MRADRLMPNGIPRYIRCYDFGEQQLDRFTVVYTGRYRHKTRGSYLYVGMSERPYHPQGFGQHGESDRPLTSGLGRKIRFDQLPPDCQRLVLTDYRELWSIPA